MQRLAFLIFCLLLIYMPQNMPHCFLLIPSLLIILKYSCFRFCAVGVHSITCGVCAAGRGAIISNDGLLHNISLIIFLFNAFPLQIFKGNPREGSGAAEVYVHPNKPADSRCTRDIQNTISSKRNAATILINK